MNAKFSSLCACGKRIAQGVEMAYDSETKKAFHLECRPVEQGDLLQESEAEELAKRLGYE